MFWNQLASRSIILLTNQLTIIFITFYLANKLGLETFSLLAAAMIILQLSSYFLDGGFFIPAVAEKNNSNDKFLLSKMWVEIYLLKFLIFILFSVLIIFVNLIFSFFNDEKLLFFTLLASATYGFFPLWFFQIQNLVGKLVIPNLIGRIFYIFMIFFLVDDENSLYLVMLSQSVCYIIPFLYSLFLFKKIIFIPQRLSMSSLKMRFIEALPFFIGNSIFNQMHNLWGLLILMFGSFTQIGIFQIADSCLRAGNAIISGSVDNLLIHHQKHKKFDYSLFLKISVAIFFIAIISEFIVAGLVNIFLVSEFHQLIPVLRITILLWFFMALIQNLNYPSIGILISQRLANKIFLIYGLLQIPLMIYFTINDKLTALNIEIIVALFSLIFFFVLSFFIHKRL